MGCVLQPQRVVNEPELVKGSIAGSVMARPFMSFDEDFSESVCSDNSAEEM